MPACLGSQDCCIQCPWPRGRPLSTCVSAGDSWTLTGKLGSVSCGITAPFSCIPMCTRLCLCPPRACFPVLWKFCNQISLAFKVKFPGGSQSLCWTPQVGKSVVGPRTFAIVQERLWYNCSAVCGSSAQWLYGRVIVTSSKRTYATCLTSQVCCSQSPCPPGRPLLTCASAEDTQRQVWLRLCGVPGSWCAQGFVWALQASLASMGFHSKPNFPLQPSCLGFSFVLEHGESFWGGIQHSSVYGCSAASCNFGVLTGEDEHILLLCHLSPLRV